jgi:nicotinate-nucleotide--dimethylbenzimidazole phosphoribosyltransferase
MNWYHQPAKAIDATWLEKAPQYQNNLTKPPGSLGELEHIAARFSQWQTTLKPAVENIEVIIMAGDHGVAAENVSAFPQAVTGEMIKNFASGGAAISVLSRFIQAELTVVNLGSVNPLPPIPQVLDYRIAAGTQNICLEPAMSQAQLEQALAIGQQMAERAFNKGVQLMIGGEMGIANTTPAACLAARLLAKYPEQVAGPGTGLNGAQVQHKTAVIERALAQHPTHEPLEVLRCLGGFEIAGLVGLFIGCAQYGIPILIDGYIVTAAALVACKINSSVNAWLIASHCSAEPAHAMFLQALQLTPLLDLAMRLGEGSGAAVAVPIIQAACKLQSEMASFAEAGVSGKI